MKTALKQARGYFRPVTDHVFTASSLFSIRLFYNNKQARNSQAELKGYGLSWILASSSKSGSGSESATKFLRKQNDIKKLRH